MKIESPTDLSKGGAWDNKVRLGLEATDAGPEVAWQVPLSTKNESTEIALRAQAMDSPG